MQSFAEFVKKNKNNPNRTIISESVSDDEWNKLVDIVTNKTLMSVGGGTILDKFSVKSEGKELAIQGESTFVLRKDSIAKINFDYRNTTGRINIEYMAGYTVDIHYVV